MSGIEEASLISLCFAIRSIRNYLLRSLSGLGAETRRLEHRSQSLIRLSINRRSSRSFFLPSRIRMPILKNNRVSFHVSPFNLPRHIHSFCRNIRKYFVSVRSGTRSRMEWKSNPLRKENENCYLFILVCRSISRERGNRLT